MPNAVYERTRARVQDTLLTFYSLAETPIESPEKLDHGDIDVVVCSSLYDSYKGEEMDAKVAAAIGATHYKTGRPTSHFAIPWPENEEKLADTTTRGGPASRKTNEQPVFIQVDINTASSPESFKWQVFNHSHGDLWNMVGSIIRRYGLTASNSGIYVRIAELEPLDKTAARFLLTNDPTTALHFLGMNEARFWRPFSKKWDLFEYVSTCRFFDPTRLSHKEEMKANERQRVRKRTLFQEWVDEYLPSVCANRKGEWAGKSRNDTFSIVKEWFGVGEQFEKRKTDELARCLKRTIWSEIRRELPVEGTRLGIAMKGLKAEIAGVDERLLPEEERRTRDVRAWFKANDFDSVKKWAMEHWEEIEEQQNQKERVACAIYFQQQETKKAGIPKHSVNEEGKGRDVGTFG